MSQPALSASQEQPDLQPDHDHAWRRVDRGGRSGVLEYRCDLCKLTWPWSD